MSKRKKQTRKKRAPKRGLRGVATNGSAIKKIKSAGMPLLAVAGGFFAGRVIGSLIDKKMPSSEDPAASFFARHKGKIIKVAIQATGGLLLVTRKSDLARYAGLGVLANGALQLVPAKGLNGLLGTEDDEMGAQILNADYYTENQLSAPEYYPELPRLEAPASMEEDISGMGELKTQDIL